MCDDYDKWLVAARYGLKVARVNFVFAELL